MIDVKLSIILPFYNCENYIAEAILSLKSQTLKNYEVILVDDGSTDNSYNIACNIIKDDERFTIISQQNSGVSKARNVALRFAKGEFIGFMDADDVCDECMYELLLKVAEVENADIVVGTRILWYKNKRYSNILKVEAGEISNIDMIRSVYSLALYGSGLNGGYVTSKVFRKSIIDNLKFNEDPSLCEDEAFLTFATIKSNKIVLAPEAKFYYRQRKSSAIYEGDFIFKLLASRIKTIKNLKNAEEYRDVIIASLLPLLVFVKQKMYSGHQLTKSQKNDVDKALSMICLKKNLFNDSDRKELRKLSYLKFPLFIVQLFFNINKRSSAKECDVLFD